MLVDFGCKHCGSNEVVKYGKERGIQYWWCKNCKRKFADNDALPGMKTPVMQISSALSMYYSGMSIDEIRVHLQQQYSNYPSDSTIYEWLMKFTDNAVNMASQYKPQVGDVWVADETVLSINGHKVWFWDLIDTKTRFLLSSRLSYTRPTEQAQRLVEQAVKVAGKAPRVIVTDKLAAYIDGIELALGADTEHIQSKGFSVKPNTNMIERFHSTLKGRTKVMRGLKTVDSALTLLDGWLIHYNYFKPHESLNGKTPAEVAGLKPRFKNWKDIVILSNPSIQDDIPALPKRIISGAPSRYGLKRKRKGVIKSKVKKAPVTVVKPSLTSVRFLKTSKSR